MASFRARARALDMLGRQQIANIPTAISELFKNAHDAYASRAEVDFFRRSRLLVLRDDGYGMTEEEFKDKWLTLGTESKLGADSDSYAPPGNKPRPVMGEKGIGRLAIASMGLQVLVLSRAIRGRKVHPLVGAFIPWRLFTLPRVDLDEIDIPVKSFNVEGFPTAEDIQELVQEARRSLKPIHDRIPAATLEELHADFERFKKLDPARVEKQLRDLDDKSPSLARGGTGTHFFVLPTDESVNIELEPPRETSGATPSMVKMLIGFTNTLTPPPGGPVMRTAFRDHKSPDLVEDVATEKEFFEPEDLEHADHHLAGTFDSTGAFSGKVRIFDKTLRFTVPPVRPRDELFHCGPFAVEFGYLQGAARESLLFHRDPEAYGTLNRKLDAIGGLYLYRDGIRVLPYGDVDFDYLRIEDRRSRGAGYYFFSYRRMFGAVSLTRAENARLEEKAGREGLRRNKAYQQLTDSLTNLLVHLAAEFFRASGSRADFFQRRKAELEKGELIRREREVAARAARTGFASKLSDALARLDSGEPRKEAKRIVRDLQAALASAASAHGDDKARLIQEAEAEARRRLDDTRGHLRLERPRGYALPRGLQQDWAAYTDALATLERDAFTPAREQVETLAAEAAKAARSAVKRTKRVREALGKSIDRARSEASEEQQQISAREAALSELVAESIKLAREEVEGSIAGALEAVAKVEAAEPDEGELAKLRVRLEDAITTSNEARHARMLRLRDAIETAITSISPRHVGARPDEVTEALEEELLALRERADADLQLTQLGMAVDIINHEFAASIRSVRSALKRLKSWADRNTALRELYSDLRASFDHLDGYLRLFTPLNRRLYRSSVTIKGSDIFSYVEALFRERLRRHEVSLEASDAFRSHAFDGFPSSFYPVFVNLIDNAVFWLRDRKPPRTIRLDVDGDAMLVLDTGPGIQARDRDAIFEMGFTRKPGGRGLGLFISREVLRKVGYSLSTCDPPSGKGTCFRIAPEPKAETRE